MASPSTQSQTGVTDDRPRKRKTTRPKYIDDYCCNDDELIDHLNFITHYCYSANFDVPQSYCEAISSNDASKWETAMMQEMKALKENETFDVVPLPKDRELVGGKWVYAVKSDKGGNETYKARYVAKCTHKLRELTILKLFLLQLAGVQLGCLHKWLCNMTYSYISWTLRQHS